MTLVTRRRRIGLWTTALLAVLAVGYALVVFLPRQKILSRKQRRLLERQRFIVASERLRTALQTADGELQQLRDVCRRWQPIESLAHHLPTYFARLTETAEKEDLAVLQLTPGDPQPLKSLQRQPVELTVAGSFPNVFAYLAEVDKMPQIAWIDQIEIIPEPDASSIVRCRMRLVVFTGFSDRREKSD